MHLIHISEGHLAGAPFLSGLELLIIGALPAAWIGYRLWRLLWKGTKTEKLYLLILALFIAAIFLWFHWMMESDRKYYGLPL